MKTLELPPQRRRDLSDFHQVLALWQWFRARCVEIHGATDLPEAFGESDGEVQSHAWVDPEDWCAPPPEYNYDWRTQELQWRSPHTLVIFRLNQDIHMNYVLLSVSDLGADARPRTAFKVRVSQHSHGEATLDGPDDTIARWEQALAVFMAEA